MIRLPAPAGFSFPRTVHSHGWPMLLPFRVDARGRTLGTTVALPGGGAADLVLREDGGDVLLEGGRVLAPYARRILGLDLDLAPFHAACAAHPQLAWIPEVGAGRLLRAPTAWEDLVKLVLTTNCSWSLTEKMVQALVALYGDPAPSGHRAFPRPERLARVPEPVLREKGRLGYRAPYVKELARLVARGEVDPESWDDPGRDAEELREEMLALPGVGPYVAENLLKFLGRPRGLALDSWMRAKYARLYHGGRPITDRTIARRYARLGPWAGLAVWFDLTRDWIDGDDPAAAWESLS